MPIALQDSIDLLYKFSRTPRVSGSGPSYFDKPAPQNCLAWFDDPSRIAAHPNLTKDDIKLVVEFSLSLLDAPLNECYS